MRKHEPPSVALVAFCRKCGYFGRAVRPSESSQLVDTSGETPECQGCVGERTDVLRFEYVRTVARAPKGPVPFDYPSRAAQQGAGSR